MFLLSLLLSLALNAADWSRFRGPNGTGVAESNNLPIQFSPSQNLAWKAAVPFGQSSPVVASGKVFLTASEGTKLLTLAYDAASGRQLWSKEVTRTHVQEIYKANDPASPTPAADDKAIYAFFPTFGLVSYTHDGKERWRLPLGPFHNFYGLSSSPVIAGGLLILLCDQAKGSFLLALDKDTGKQRWKTERRDHMESWSVPIVHRDQIVTIGSNRLDSYYLNTGESRWWLPLSSAGSMGTPVMHGENLIVTYLGMDKPWLPTFASVIEKLDKNRDSRLSVDECKDEKDWAEHFPWVDKNGDKQVDQQEWDAARQLGIGEYGAISVGMNGKGRLDASAIQWRFQRNVPYIPAPVLYNGVFYMVKTGGIVTALDPSTGKLLKQGRSQQAPGEYYASPVAADGKIFLLSAEGKLSVVKAGAEWEVLSVNDLAEECFATPAISDGRIFVRTRGNLYSFAAAK